MERKSSEKYFSWSDAWVFTALYYTHKGDESTLDLSKIIAAGDALNHSIITGEEIKTAFIKLQTRGIVIIFDNKVIFTDLGKLVIDKAQKVSGGLFSMVDISLQKLNSNRLKLPFINEVNDCKFITDDVINESYLQYVNMHKKV